MPNIGLKPILPRLPSAKDFTAAIEKAVLKTAKLTQRDLQSTTRTWQHKPTFSVNILPTDNPYTIIAGTDDDIYGYVDAGTKAHVIRAKNARYLRFSLGYKAKTRPNIIGSQDGGANGAVQYAAQVHHPGTKARHFMTTIAQRRQVTLNQEVSAAIAKVAQKSKG